MYGRSGTYVLQHFVLYMYHLFFTTCNATSGCAGTSTSRVLDEWLQLSCLLPPGR